MYVYIKFQNYKNKINKSIEQRSCAEQNKLYRLLYIFVIIMKFYYFNFLTEFMLYYKSRHIVHTVYDYKVFILLFCVSVYSLLLDFENKYLKLIWHKCHL